MTKERVDLFLARRISSDKGHRSGAMIGIARISVAICVAVMLVAVAVIVGFKHELRAKLTGMDSHITINSVRQSSNAQVEPLVRNADFEERISTFPGFRSLSTFATHSGIVRFGGQMQGVHLRGVDQAYDSLFLAANLTEGTLPRVGTAERKKDLLISATLAGKLDVKVGDKVEFIFSSPSSPVRRDSYRVCGIYSSGMASLEEGLTITDIRNVQRLLGWEENQVTGYKIMAEEFEGSYELCELIRAEAYLAGGAQMWRTAHLYDNYPQIFDWLSTHDINGLVIIVIMVIVALLNMMTALLIIVFERIRMIGTLKALGMRNGVVQRVFLWCSLRVILSGLLWGNLLGGGLLLIQHLTGAIRLDPEAYLISEVPVAFDWLWWGAIDIVIPLVILSLLTIPVAITSRIKPDQTLKYQ